MFDTNNTLKKKENQYHHLTKKDRYKFSFGIPFLNKKRK